MDDLSNKPPKSAREYYVNLFCGKNKSKQSRGVRKALQSWRSLSTAEQQPFIDKVNLIREKYKEDCINYLKSVEPFMKRKVIRERENIFREVNSKHCLSEPEISQKNLQPVVDNSQDTNETITTKNADQNNQDTASAIDQYAIDSTTSHEIVNAISETEGISRISEPTPPCTKNGKELFEMVTNVNGVNNLEWKDLSQIEKYKYRSAVLAIKREYIKDYQKYLESLPSIELFEHYIKTLDKYC